MAPRSAPDIVSTLHAYWIISQGQRPADLGSPARYWKEVPGYEVAKKVQFSDLLDKTVPQLDKEGSPLRTLPARDWQWHEVDQQLTLLDGQNKDKNKYVGSDLFHGELSVADDTASDFISACTEGVKLIRAAIEQGSDYGEGIKIFNEMGIVEGALRLQLRQIETLRDKVRRLEAQRFTYSNLPGLEPRATIKGISFTLKNETKFFEVRSHGKDWPTLDQSRWNYTGDKVHISVESAPKSTKIRTAWDTILPILLDSRIVKECKVTNVEFAKMQLDMDPKDKSAARIYYGAQISVYLHAARDDVDAAKVRFADLMKRVSQALAESGIRGGVQPESDLRIDPYLSYRHDIDDLVDDKKIKEKKLEAEQLNYTEADYYLRVYIDPFEDPERYSKHKAQMEEQRLYQLLKTSVGRS
jgi:hypothetical protein